MEEWNQWRLFLNSGSVLDYLAYKRARLKRWKIQARARAALPGAALEKSA